MKLHEFRLELHSEPPAAVNAGLKLQSLKDPNHLE